MFFDDVDPFVIASVSGRVYTISRARLRKFVLLEQLRRKNDVAGYLRLCGVDPEVGCGAEHLELYVALVRMNGPQVKLPFLLGENRSELPEWDYEGREIVSWVYLLLSRCNLSLTEIWNLSIDDFYALVQEALVDIQFSREWDYSLSQIAYDAQGHHRPLDRPIWMRIKGLLQKRKRGQGQIPAAFIPKGIVVSASKNGLNSSES